MPTTITHSEGSIVPVAIDGYEASREARTVVHPVLNRSSPDITLRAMGLRTGTLTCVFDDQNDAISAYGSLSIPQILTLTNDDIPSINMTFVVGPEGEQATIALDLQTRWILNLPYVEVAT